ncbi:MAG: (2Fe-2S)-binding protein [Nitrospirae bacterium]|nr:(2Fe-2S)-binding protein [Nitrospirota bacterium]
MDSTAHTLDLSTRYRNRPLVSVELGGVVHRVPEGVTVLEAMWYAGIPVVRGAGCLGGACGACTTTYRAPGGMAPKTGLGCQIEVREGMSITLYPVDPPHKPTYRMAELDDPAEALFTIYPETRRCTLCDACTTVCPQDIPVRATVRQMMNRQFDLVAPAFDECVNCNLCAMVCEVGIAPNLLGLYARKAVARAMPAPPELTRRMRQIADGEWDGAWRELLALSGEALVARCVELRGAA